ncbi:MAG: stress response translation initiation inhibitor YciH [Candidatus Aenigmarchaeota archaeon]|nr:stress response translation initiation inhibitor YciH [Candidatus Aenigmarchaeota archaeon]
MSEICPKCGLPKELCTCGVREREEQKITVFIEKRRFSKPITMVEGIGPEGKDVIKQLKSKLACGGTYKNGFIELQGDHRSKIIDLLVSLGYDASRIEII